MNFPKPDFASFDLPIVMSVAVLVATVTVVFVELNFNLSPLM